LKQLELLAALQRGDGLSVAARRLNVSQSGASRAARRLEKLRRITLFDDVAVNAVMWRRSVSFREK
jgi:DNA-binding transcriptional LysR family regulator